jgi:hypothetical protein
MTYEFSGCKCGGDGLSGPLEDLQKFTADVQRSIQTAGDRAAKEFCKISPIDDMLKNIPGMSQVFAVAPLLQSGIGWFPFPPLGLAMFTATMMLDVARTCSVSDAVRRQATTAMVVAVACGILAPLSRNPIVQAAAMGAIGVLSGGSSTVAWPFVTAALEAAANSYGIWADIRAGGGIRPESAMAFGRGAVVAVGSAATLGLLDMGQKKFDADALGQMGDLWKSLEPAVNQAQKEGSNIAKAGQDLEAVRKNVAAAGNRLNKQGAAAVKKPKTPSPLPKAPPKTPPKTPRRETPKEQGALLPVLLTVGAGVAAASGAPVVIPAALAVGAVLSLKK